MKSKKVSLINLYPNDIDFFIDENNKIPATPPPKKISEYIEGRRIMPSTTPFPGFWENWRTHYAVEIMDSLSPFSPIQYVDVMAAAQVVKSATAENVIAYYMDALPSPILYVSGTDDLLSKWGPKRLEPLIDSIGMRNKIHAFVDKKSSRASGDKAKQKLFTGGFLEMASGQSPSSLRADSIKILILEEVDSAPPHLTTGEGRFDKVAEARCKAFDSKKKILAVSTPTTFDMSLIHKRYKLGDQRQYLMPCPHCKKPQILERGNVTGSHGLRADHEAGELKLVYYICDHCHEAFFEYHKNWMIPRGHWEPTAKGEKNRRSYHINSLYSAVGMYSWISYWKEYKEALQDPEGMRSFINLQDGLPYKESGSRPKLEKVIELRGNYDEGTVPDDVLYLTVGVDVQRGRDNDDNYPARLELEVLGVGSKYRTWSITYKVIVGAINDPYSGAWEKLNDWAASGGLSFRKKSGYAMNPVMIFIDSGFEQSTVFDFCKRWQSTYPIKGFKTLLRKKNEKADRDEAGPLNTKRYRPVKTGGGTIVYDIATNYYKNSIYNNLNIQRQNTEQQKPGFCDFPITYGEKYFKGLTAEEKLADRTFYLPRGRDNEQLDTRVYSLCAADVYLDAKVMEFKVAAKVNGATTDELLRINHRFIIDVLESKNKDTLIVK